MPRSFASRPFASLPIASLIAAALLAAACAADRPQPPPAPLLRVAKEGSTLGRIDLFRYDAATGRAEQLAHCPEGCAEAFATLPADGSDLEVVATGWPYLRMQGFKSLPPCATPGGGFVSPCRFAPADAPPGGVVAIFVPRPGVAQPDSSE